MIITNNNNFNECNNNMNNKYNNKYLIAFFLCKGEATPKKERANNNYSLTNKEPIASARRIGSILGRILKTKWNAKHC